MATTPPPSYGYGQQTPASIDAVNIWMRAQPWYADLMQSWGKDPGHPSGLTDAQRTQIVRAAQANGVIVDESNQELDPNGNFRNIGHGLRNTMIVAGLAAATIATMGAAGVFSGAAAGGEIAATSSASDLVGLSAAGAGTAATEAAATTGALSGAAAGGGLLAARPAP